MTYEPLRLLILAERCKDVSQDIAPRKKAQTGWVQVSVTLQEELGLVWVLPLGFIQMAARLWSPGAGSTLMCMVVAKKMTKSNQALAKGTKVSF